MVLENLRDLATTDDRGVSTIIGVILMVAVTIVMAGVVGGYVLNQTNNMDTAQPNTQVEFNYDAADDQIAIVHDGGDTLTTDNTGKLSVSGDIAAGDISGGAWGANLDETGGSDTSEAVLTGSIEAGDTIFDTEDDSGAVSGDVSSGDRVELVWHSPSGDSSQRLGEFQAP